MQRLQKLFTRVLFTEILSHLIVLNFSFERDIKCKVELKCECQRMVGKGKKAQDAILGVSQIRYKILYILHSTTNHAFPYFVEEVFCFLPFYFANIGRSADLPVSPDSLQQFCIITAPAHSITRRTKTEQK